MHLTTNRKIVLSSYPDGIPAESNFDLVEEAIPSVAEGQVLCGTRFLSLDPYMRSQIAGRHLSGSLAPGDMMRGESVGEVIESKHPDYQPGQMVRCMGGWQEFTVQDGASLTAVHPDIQPPSYALSLLGMTGLTAWAGMIWQANVKAGDKVLIPAVTGGVGAAAAQFCRNQGAEVIGIAGSADKCVFALQELGVCEERGDFCWDE